jgi:hypothetical protein
MKKNTSQLLRAILLGGIVAGTIDIGAACLISGRDVIYILHAVAGGLLAKASFEGGMPTAVLGAFLQEAMSILIAAIYVAVSRFTPTFLHRWVLGGVLYGTLTFIVMNYVVVPLSAWAQAPQFSPRGFVLNLLAMILFGIIISFFASRTRSK